MRALAPPFRGPWDKSRELAFQAGIRLRSSYADFGCLRIAGRNVVGKGLENLAVHADADESIVCRSPEYYERLARWDRDGVEMILERSKDDEFTAQPPKHNFISIEQLVCPFRQQRYGAGDGHLALRARSEIATAVLPLFKFEPDMRRAREKPGEERAMRELKWSIAALTY